MRRNSPELKGNGLTLGGKGVGRRDWAWSPPGPDLAHLVPLPYMEQKLLQQVKGLKPGRVGSGLTSLQHRPLGSWWLGAQLAETRDLQSGVPVMQRIPLATTVSLEQAARQQEPSGAVRVRPLPAASAEAWEHRADEHRGAQGRWVPRPLHRGSLCVFSGCEGSLELTQQLLFGGRQGSARRFLH